MTGSWSLGDPSPSASGKLWKPVERISTGVLREEHKTQEAALPMPVLSGGLLSTPTYKLNPTPTLLSSPLMIPIHRITLHLWEVDTPFTSHCQGAHGTPSIHSLHQPPTLSSSKKLSYHPSTDIQSSPASLDKALLKD